MNPDLTSSHHHSGALELCSVKSVLTDMLFIVLFFPPVIVHIAIIGGLAEDELCECLLRVLIKLT